MKLDQEIVLSEALVELIESGIGEDAHFRGSWEDLDDDDLERIINDGALMTNVLNLARETLVEQLKLALEDRRRVTERYGRSS